MSKQIENYFNYLKKKVHFFVKQFERIGKSFLFFILETG